MGCACLSTEASDYVNGRATTVGTMPRKAAQTSGGLLFVAT
jgi:hypothetical protein